MNTCPCRRLIRVCAIAVVLVCPFSARAQAPPGFVIDTVAEGLSEPIAMQQATDGRLFIAERGGTIRVVENGRLLDAPFATLDVFAENECGLLGLALDPNFDTNGFVYVFITLTFERQQIIRLTDVGGVATDPTILRDQLPTTGTVHNGGCLRIGPDGMLYFAIGDNGLPENGRRMQTLSGKLSRINLDGSVPRDNPFVTPTGAPRAAYAIGFRNPIRFCFAPDGRLFVVDVGSSGVPRREEINIVTAGADGGWPDAEGFAGNADSKFVQPLLAYSNEGSAITGLAYYDADQFPQAYRGNLFHLDFVSGGLFRVVFSGNTAMEHKIFLETGGGPVDLTVGIDGSLLFTEFFSGSVKRVRYARALDDRSDNDNGATPNATAQGGDERDVIPPVPPVCGQGVIAFLMFTGLALGFFPASRARGESRRNCRSA